MPREVLGRPIVRPGVSLNRIITATSLVCVIVGCVVGGTASAPLLVVGMVLLLTSLWRTRFVGGAAGDGSTTSGSYDSSSTGHGHHDGHHGHESAGGHLVATVATVAALAVVAATVATDFKSGVGA